MIDFSSLQTKVDALKAIVEANSISPTYLGALLDDFIQGMKFLDYSDSNEQFQDALSKISVKLDQVIESVQNLSELDESVSRNSLNIFNLNDAVKNLNKEQKSLNRLYPVACTDEDDLQAKAMNADYPVGQQFYIPEES